MKELAPGATQQIEKLLKGKTLEAVTVIPVESEVPGETAYQNILLTVKDGKLIYMAFLGDECPTEDDAINEATKWVDRYYYNA